MATIDGDNGPNTLTGGEDDDSVRGFRGDDLLKGGIGDDTLVGGADDDTLLGGTGDDWIRPGIGDDRIDGGDGIDVLDYSDAPAGVTVSIFGSHPRVFTGGSGTEYIRGMDALVGSDFGDRLTGGPMGSLFDFVGFINGFGGDDLITVSGPTYVDGGEGNDTIIGQIAIDSIRGGSGDDLIKSDGDPETGSGKDTVKGEDGDDTILAGAGNDSIFGGQGNDVLDGGDGFDIADYRAETGPVTVDLTIAGPQATGAGSDTLIDIERVFSGSGDDRLTGDDNRNAFRGGGGGDTVSGGGASDALYGETGDDSLAGGVGKDTLNGEAGRDTLAGDFGADLLRGGGGADLFDLSGNDGSRDVVADFQTKLDHFKLDPGQSFTAVAKGDFDADGQMDDTRLTHAGGQVDVLGVTLAGGAAAQLAAWNELVI